MNDIAALEPNAVNVAGAGPFAAGAPNTNGLIGGADEANLDGGGEVVMSSEGLAGAGVALLDVPNTIGTDGASLVIAVAELLKLPRGPAAVAG